MPRKAKEFSAKLVGVRLREDLVRSLKVLSARTDRTLVSLLEESVADVLKKYGQEILSEPFKGKSKK